MTILITPIAKLAMKTMITMVTVITTNNNKMIENIKLITIGVTITTIDIVMTIRGDNDVTVHLIWLHYW